MAFKLAEMFVHISAKGLGGVLSSVKGLMNPLNAASQGLSGLSGMANMARSSLTALAGPILGLSASLFSASGVLISIGAIAAGGIGMAKLAAGAETAEVAFTTMLGSAERAKDVLKDVTGFAAATPFELPELTDATRKLLAFGTAQEELIPTLNMVGDIASGISQPIGEIAEIYGKARVQGRLFAEDINQLTGRGIPIIQELAKQFGVTDGEVKKLVESGQITFSNLETAFRSLTSEGGKFAGMMAAQSKTGAGMWSTMMDNIKGLARGFGEALLPAAKTVMSALIDMSGGAGESFAPLKEAVGDVAMLFANGLVGAIDLARGAMPYLVAYGGVLRSAFNAATEMISAASSALWDMMAPIRELIPSVDSIGDAFLRGTEAAKFFFENWRLYLDLGIEQAKLFGENAWQQIKTFADNAVTSLMWFGDNWKDVFKTIWEYTKTIVENLGKNLGEFFFAVTQLMQGNGFDFRWTGLEEGFKSSIKELPKLAEAALREITPEIDRINKELSRKWLERGKGRGLANPAPDERYDLRGATKDGEKATEDEEENKDGRFAIHDLIGFSKMIQTGAYKKEHEDRQKRIAAGIEKIANEGVNIKKMPQQTSISTFAEG